MKNANNRWAWFLILMTLLSSCKDIDAKEEELQIRALWDKACSSVCNGDWENYSSCWAHSSKTQVLHPEQGEWLTGWDKIKEKYEALLKAGMRCSFPKNELTVNVSRSGDMAWGTIDCIIQFDDSTKTQVHYWQTGVFEKIDGEWKIVLGVASTPGNLKD